MEYIFQFIFELLLFIAFCITVSRIGKIEAHLRNIQESNELQLKQILKEMQEHTGVSRRILRYNASVQRIMSGASTPEEEQKTDISANS